MKEKKVLRSFVMISQIGIGMLVSVFLCAGIGYWLNSRFHNEGLFVLMLGIGVGAALRHLYVVTKSFYAADLKREQEEKDYLQGLKEYRKEHPEADFSDVMEGKKKRYPENQGETRH